METDGADASGMRDFIAVHAHLIEFTLLERGMGDPNQRPGRRYLEEYEKGAVKDVATLGENEAVTVLARFTPWAGVYVGWN